MTDVSWVCSFALSHGLFVVSAARPFQNGKSPRVMLCLVIQKAFNIGPWGFLDSAHMMERFCKPIFGFGPSLTRMGEVEICASPVWVNGRLERASGIPALPKRANASLLTSRGPGCRTLPREVSLPCTVPCPRPLQRGLRRAMV